MPIINNKTVQCIKQDKDDLLLEKKCIRCRDMYSCEFMLDFRTCLCPAPKKNSKIKQFVKVEAKIEKICKGKIIIFGTLHKIICYTSLPKCKCSSKTKHLKHIKVPFSCFIDINCKDAKDDFEIVDSKILCNYSEIIHSHDKCSKKAVLTEKDIIKIAVQKKSCNNYFGNTVVDSEICFVPAVNPDTASVSVDVDPKNFKVQLICCDLIVVCGFITKTVTFCDGTPKVKKDILVQVNVPVNIEDLCDVYAKKWEVTKAQVCDSCSSFICPNKNTTLYHTLVEKDIIAVEVSHKNKD